MDAEDSSNLRSVNTGSLTESAGNRHGTAKDAKNAKVPTPYF